MIKRVLRVVLCFFILILLIGCSKNVDSTNLENKDIFNGNIKQEKEGYVEEVIELSDNIGYILDIVKLDNGNISVGAFDKDFNSKVFTSEDNGVSWKEKEIQHIDFGKEIRSHSISLLKNGDILISYVFGYDAETIIRYAILNESGEINEVELDVDQEIISGSFNNAPIDFMSLNNGDLIYTTFDKSEIVQLDGKNFKEKYRYKTELLVDNVSNVADNLILTSMESIDVYDINTGELRDSLEELESKIINSTNTLSINGKSDTNIYYYSTEGLFCYDLLKKENELLIDDGKYITNPNFIIDKLLELENNTYLMIIIDSSTGAANLVRYSYDPNYVKVDDSEILVYSLTENKFIRNMISLCEAENPNISIKYEVGVSNSDAIQESDALKTLIIEIMAGKGPDIILLDGLPVENFIDNKFLADMSEIFSEYENELFQGVVNAYKVNGEVYQLPMSIKIPMMIGNKDIINQINDIESLLTVVKENAAKSENRIFEKLGTPEDFISSIYCIYENNCLSDKKINKDNLIEFLNIAKEIYNISKEKNDIYLKQEHGDMVDCSIFYMNNEVNMNLIQNISISEMDYSKNQALLAYGGIGNLHDIELLVNMLINKPYMDYKILKKEDKNIFIPNLKVGINNNSKNKEVSKDIIKRFLEQSISIDNITIHKESFINGLQIDDKSLDKEKYNEENEHYIKSVTIDVDENGNKLEFPKYYANDDDISRLVNEVDKLNVEPDINMVLLDEVSSQFKKIIEEELDVEEAVLNILKNLELYLAE